MTSMEISPFKSYTIAVATVLFPIFVFSIPLSSGGGNINQLRLIGSVEGKSYFAEGNLALNWTDARTYCQSHGLNLATISTVAQATLLIDAYNNVTFDYWHWTAARDSRTPTQFSWDHNNEVLNSAVLRPYISVDALTCMTFLPEYKYFAGYPCAYHFKILCEQTSCNITR